MGWSVVDVLRGVDGAPPLERVDVIPPMLFAVMIALAGLWRACGVEPIAVLGQSQGEIAAAHVAGALSLRDAAMLVGLRSQMLIGLLGAGAIASVGLGVRDMRSRLERWDGKLELSAVNGPALVGVSGDLRALEELLAELRDEGVRAHIVAGTVGTHSAQVELLRKELLELCAGLSPHPTEIPLFSTVTGGPLDGTALDGEHWFRNMREPVQLDRAVRALLKEGCRAFIEVSSHPVLTLGFQETVDEALPGAEEVVLVGSLRREQGGLERFLRSAGELWVGGVDVDWGSSFCENGRSAGRFAYICFSAGALLARLLCRWRGGRRRGGLGQSRSSAARSDRRTRR